MITATTDPYCSSRNKDKYYLFTGVSNLVLDIIKVTDPPVSSTNKTDRHDITEILLKVALSTIKLQSWKNNESALFLVCVLMSSLYI
jgi:hypothetical protein